MGIQNVSAVLSQVLVEFYDHRHTQVHSVVLSLHESQSTGTFIQEIGFYFVVKRASVCTFYGMWS